MAEESMTDGSAIEDLKAAADRLRSMGWSVVVAAIHYYPDKHFVHIAPHGGESARAMIIDDVIKIIRPEDKTHEA